MFRAFPYPPGWLVSIQSAFWLVIRRFFRTASFYHKLCHTVVTGRIKLFSDRYGDIILELTGLLAKSMTVFGCLKKNFPRGRRLQPKACDNGIAGLNNHNDIYRRSLWACDKRRKSELRCRRLLFTTAGEEKER